MSKTMCSRKARRKGNIEALEIKYGGIGMTLKEILEAGGESFCCSYISTGSAN